uniref:Reverse transcriptase domain-containing protein n=1 Tax=Cannabis sativa TaxID=3483 RepID=A0A803NXZ1_CANSA
MSTSFNPVDPVGDQLSIIPLEEEEEPAFQYDQPLVEDAEIDTRNGNVCEGFGRNKYIFQFYHEIDVQRVQLHDIRSGVKTERMVKDVGNHIGSFVKFDENNFNGVWRDYLRGMGGSLAMLWKDKNDAKEESALPWCIIGDLNNVMSQVDKRGENPYPNWLIEGFQQVVSDCDLVDLDLLGHQFTWEKGPMVMIFLIHEDNVALLQPVLEEEVRSVVFQMHLDKSSGPNGMAPAFYQKCWHIVGQDVVRLVQGFFWDNVMPKDLNATNLVLIPKKKSPSVMGDLRPISLCNVLYKFISKVLANKLKRHKQQGKNGCMALKLDMSKAYDRMEGSFLQSILLRMGFSIDWVRMIMECLRTITYNIVHGRDVLGPINPSKRICQGDPISPYLFIICAKGFLALIRLYEEKKWIHGCRVVRRAPFVTHMLFADDSFLYCTATREEAQRVLGLLNKFEKALGQKVNLNKSSIFFSSNTDDGVHHTILSTLHMRATDDHNFYLGLPSVIGGNKTMAFGFLKEKVRKRIQNWDSKQGWRLLTNSSSLVVRVFQARYYTQGTFLDAELGSNPSYAWRSVFKAQEIDNMSWDEELLEDLFVQRDVELIRSIPLPSTLNMDTWYWAYEAYGGCSVKSAYPALQVRNERWNLQDNSGFWKKFWGPWYDIPIAVHKKKKQSLWPNIIPKENRPKYHAIGDSVDKIAMILWDVWGARNDFLWNKKIASVERVVSSAITYLELWKFAQIKNGVVSTSSGQLSTCNELWIKPSMTAAVKSSGDLKPFMAEAMSLKEGLSWVKNTWGDGASFEGFVPMRW